MRPYTRGLMAEEVLQNTAVRELCERETSPGDLTWDHVEVVVEEVRVSGDEGEEDCGVRRPGDDPDRQERETCSPEPPLHLGVMSVFNKQGELVRTTSTFLLVTKLVPGSSD